MIIAQQSWSLTDLSMRASLSRWVRRKKVIELGGSDGELARLLTTEFEADHVTVIDKERDFFVERQKDPFPNVTMFRGYLADFLQEQKPSGRCYQVVLASWPINNHQFCRDAVAIMKHARRVVIIGKNDGLTACGTSFLWDYLITRHRAEYVLNEFNDLLVYSDKPRSAEQRLLPIEKHGLSYDLCLTT